MLNKFQKSLLNINYKIFVTNVWSDNGECKYNEHRLSLHEIPAFREDVFHFISEYLHKKGIYNPGLAYEVSENTWRGQYAKFGYMDDETMTALFHLDIDQDFVLFLENVNYMFHKAHGVAYLCEAIQMIYYKMHYAKEYNKIMLKK